MKKPRTPEARKRAALKHGAVTLAQHRRRAMKDPAFARAYRSPELEASVAVTMVDLRKKAGLSQNQLAAKTGMKQSAIARIERGAVNVTLGTMQRLAGALGYTVEVRFQHAAAGR